MTATIARLLAAGTALALGACQSTGGPGLAGTLGASPSGKPIAVESIEGAPAEVRTALSAELSEAATQQRVEIVEAGQVPRYRVKGYLTTEPSEDGGTRLAFVWDVFGADKRLAKRVTGSSPLQAAAPDPWAGLDRQALRRLAARSMEEIAAFLAEPGQPTAEPARAAEETTG